MLVGSFASMFYGEPRLTKDIDIVVELRFDQVASLCGGFPAPEFFVSLPAAHQAVAQGSQFSVIHPTSGEKIDFMVARNDGWGRSQIERRRVSEILPGLHSQPRRRDPRENVVLPRRRVRKAP